MHPSSSSLHVRLADDAHFHDRFHDVSHSRESAADVADLETEDACSTKMSSDTFGNSSSQLASF